jgi:hypothetical protein
MNFNSWELLRIQAIKAAGLEGHSKANELYYWCWAKFGRYGANEVLCALCDMAEIEIEDLKW